MDITFIVGCSRSGTSILGELLRAHPNVVYIFEEPVWKALEGDSHQMLPADVPIARQGKVRKWMKIYKQKKKVLVNKDPRHTVRIPLLKSIFPEAKIIHIVRDGRDVACSLKTGLCGKTWAHVKPANWKEIETNYEGLARCAHAWKSTMEVAIKDLTNCEHLQIKYEDLVANPLKVSKEIFAYLKIPLHEKVIEFASNIQNKMKDSYVASNQTRWYTEDHTIRIGRWKENMTAEEQKEVELILRPTLDHFGYK